jgi:hypothetical protein
MHLRRSIRGIIYTDRPFGTLRSSAIATLYAQYQCEENLTKLFP